MVDRTALLVDDDASTCDANRQKLQEDGYTVMLARDPFEGLSRAKQSLPNIIYTHLVAPGHENVAFIQSLRADDSCRHISVIVLGGGSRPRPGLKQLRPVHRDNL
jgi:CheY-like chemotaxis protein